MKNFKCFNCNKVVPMFEPEKKFCPSCGSSNGEIISSSRVKEGMDAGVFFNIDPKTGKRVKPKR